MKGLPYRRPFSLLKINNHKNNKGKNNIKVKNVLKNAYFCRRLYIKIALNIKT